MTGANPAQGVKLPKARASQETVAYTLTTIQAMMKAVKDHPVALTAIALAAWAGVSRSELEGIRWEDLQDAQLHVRRGVVEGRIGDTKTTFRRGAIPIIAPLKKVLDGYRRGKGSPVKGWIFPSRNPEKPMRMNNVLRRHIAPSLEEAGIDWSGWHAFRRGLATNLADLDIKDDVIQRVLRHGQLPTTQRHYRKTRDVKVVEAMKKLEGKVATEAAARRADRKMV